MVDIVVAGAAGRMGARIIACLGEAPDLRLVAALEASGHPALGADAGDIAGVGRRGVPVTADATAALTAGRMLVEFSTSIRPAVRDRKSTRLNSSHGYISYAVFCLKKKKKAINLKTDRL